MMVRLATLSIIVFSTLVAFALPNADQHLSATKKVIIVHSYPPGEWYHGINKGFLETVGHAEFPVDMTPMVFHSHFWQNRPQEDQEHERKRIIANIQNIKPDLVIIFDDEAADFLMASLLQLNFPLMFNGINKNVPDLKWLTPESKKRLAGVLELQRPDEAVRVLRQFNPKAKKIAILSSQSPSSQIISPQYSDAFKKIKAPNAEVEVTETLLLKYWEDWKKAIPRLNKSVDAVCIVVPYDVRDPNNIEISPFEMGRWITKNLKKPSFGNTTSHTLMGMMFSVALPPQNLGRQSAEQALRFFRGESLEKIGIENARYYELQINKKEVARLGYKIPKQFFGVAKFFDGSEMNYGR